MLGDMVIGITSGKMGESYKVDIGAYLPAQLSFYAFEGATKKSKPDLKVRPGFIQTILFCAPRFSLSLLTRD